MRRALSPASITSPERITTQIPPGASLSRNPRIRITLPPPSCLQTGAHVRRRALGFPFLSPQARTEVSSSLLVKNLVDHYGDAPFGGGSSTGWRVDPAREGVQTALVIFFIFVLQATALDMLAAFGEDVRFKSAKRERH